MGDRTDCFPCASPGRSQAKLNNRHSRFNLISPLGRGELNRLTFRRLSDDVTAVTEKSAGHTQNHNAMSSRRFTGVVLIVALLGWSVNQRIVACAGLPSRAAVGAQAGSPPAPKPEPSPSRHNCCPLESKHAEKAQPSSLPDCKIHSNLDLSCCSIANNPASPLPFQKVSRFELQPFATAIVSHELLTAIAPSEDTPLSAIFPIPLINCSTTVLRL